MKNRLLIIFLSLIAIPFVSADRGDEGCWGGMGGIMYGNYGAGGMLFGWIFSILIFITLILLIVWLIKKINK